MSSSKGFTLLEAVITIAIIGIVATIAVPTYIKRVTYARRGEAKNMLSELRQVQISYFANAQSTSNRILCPKTVYTPAFEQSLGAHTAHVYENSCPEVTDDLPLLFPDGEADLYCSKNKKRGASWGTYTTYFPHILQAPSYGFVYQYQFLAMDYCFPDNGSVGPGEIFIQFTAASTNRYDFPNPTSAFPAWPYSDFPVDFRYPINRDKRLFAIAARGNIDEDPANDLIYMDFEGKLFTCRDDTNNEEASISGCDSL